MISFRWAWWEHGLVSWMQFTDDLRVHRLSMGSINVQNKEAFRGRKRSTQWQLLLKNFNMMLNDHLIATCICVLSYSTTSISSRVRHKRSLVTRFCCQGQLSLYWPPLFFYTRRTSWETEQCCDGLISIQDGVSFGPSVTRGLGGGSEAPSPPPM